MFLTFYFEIVTDSQEITIMAQSDTLNPVSPSGYILNNYNEI